MNFLECRVPFPGNEDSIQDKFEHLFIAHGAPKEMALFCRTTEDRKEVVYLMTPTAAEQLSGLISANWELSHGVMNYEWTFLVGHDRAKEGFSGLTED